MTVDLNRRHGNFHVERDTLAPVAGIYQELTHQSIIKATFLLYGSTPTGMMTACGEMGAVSII
jgi:hypothetical protein